MKAPRYQLSYPTSCDDVITGLAQDEDHKVIAGGQSLGAMLNLRLARPNRLFDLSSIDELRSVRVLDEEVVIGAMVTHANLEDMAIQDHMLGFMSHVARGIAYRAVRNCGTIGGSLCHADPASDWVSALSVLNATLNISGPLGQRNVAIDTFMKSAYETDLSQDEVLVSITVPRLKPGTKWSYRKSCRKTGEFALAIVAAILDPTRESLRLVFGALDGAPVIWCDDAVFRRVTEGDDLADVIATFKHRLTEQQTSLHEQLLIQVRSDLGVPS